MRAVSCVISLRRPSACNRIYISEMPPTTTFLQAALNGDRIHPAAPRTPTAIAEAARAAVDAGAHSVHVHSFNDAGQETLDGGACARVLRAIRARCSATPISLTTSAAIVANPDERFSIVEAWEE